MIMESLLEIHGLRAGIEGKEILKGIDLVIRPGELHALMGPNGAGKSTLASVLAGRPDYRVNGGEVLFRGKNLLEMAPEERSWAGIFLSFQYPVEIPGVSITSFMKTAVDARRRANGQEPLSPAEYLSLLREKMAFVGMKSEFAKRDVNAGFSGGEKKRNEIFQMAMLEPTLSILDETDSGLDVDALRTVSDGVSAMKGEDRSFIVITHYKRLLDSLRPTHVHVLKDGSIVRSGGMELVEKIENEGYDSIDG